MQQPLFDPHARILRSGQYEIKKTLSEKIPIKNFYSEVEQEESVQNRIAFYNAEIEDLEKKIREKRHISQEKVDRILEQGQEEAKKVMEEAEQHAFDRVQKSVKEKESVLQQTAQEAEQIKSQAEEDAREIRSDAGKDAVNIKKNAQSEGFNQGHLEGIDQGKQEVSFAVERLHGVIAETSRERERILVHSETQVINLVLTMVTKVVKKMTVEHQQVVIENVKASLELLRGAMSLFIHVSPYDYNFVASFKEELVRMIESRADLKFIEDPTVDPGGVFVETDMGDVDATIRSQLEELEQQLRFYMPVTVTSPETKKRQKKEQQNIQQEESQKQQTYEDELHASVPKTPFAQREEYTSTVDLSETFSNNGSPDDKNPSKTPLNNGSSDDKNLSETPLNNSSSDDKIGDVEIPPTNDASPDLKTEETEDAEVINAELIDDPIFDENVMESYHENQDPSSPKSSEDILS